MIVGAGIGGLSSALALRQAGWHVRVFERAASPRELGFGLALAPNAIAALRELGVADAVLARSFEPRRAELRRLDGTVVKRAALPPDVLGGPMVVALRPALHGALLDAVGPDTIILGRHAAGFTLTGNRVTLQMTDDSTAEGDLLIGADGVGSVIRRVLHPAEMPPRSSGIVAVRGAVHGAVRYLGDLSGIYYLGRGVEAFLVRASDTGIYWALSLADELVPPGMRDPSAIVAHLAPRFDTTFRAVTSETEDLRCDELVDRDPLPVWGRGIVTLLGDAAHPVLPHTGQGAAQAMVDAVTLGKALGADDDIPSALRSYEGERRSKTTALLRQGRRTAGIMRTTNPLVCGVREAVVRLIPAKLFIRPFMKFYLRVNRRAGTDVRSCFVLTLITTLALACLQAGAPAIRSKTGLVISASDIASRVGAAVLTDGGNAVDAAIATAFALAVTHPIAGNIGGGGFLLYRAATGDTAAYDFRETAPARASPTMFLKAVWSSQRLVWLEMGFRSRMAWRDPSRRSCRRCRSILRRSRSFRRTAFRTRLEKY